MSKEFEDMSLFSVSAVEELLEMAQSYLSMVPDRSNLRRERHQAVFESITQSLAASR